MKKLEVVGAMKIGIVYFSGTGNTYRVGEVFKHMLENKCEVIDMIDISQNDTVVRAYDLLIIGSPTYSKVASQKMHDFIDKNITKRNNPNAKVITYITHSWGEAYGHLTMRNKMMRRGFEVISALDYFMPNNHYAMMGEKETVDMIKDIHKEVVSKTENALQLIESGHTVLNQKSVIKRKKNELVYELLKKMWIPSYAQKYLTVERKKCVKCKLCVKECPAGNISLVDESIVFGNACIACAKCFNSCPTDAYLVNGREAERYTLNKYSIDDNLKK